MFKRILVPLDGSPLSEAALPLARRLLEGGAEEVTLFAVGEEPHSTPRRRRGLRRALPLAANPATGVPGVLEPMPPRYDETKDQAVARVEAELLDYLSGVAAPLLETGRQIHAEVQIGDPAAAIIALAKRGSFDVVVMATHGRSGLRKTLLGSVAAELVRSGVKPVLLIRPKNSKRRG